MPERKRKRKNKLRGTRTFGTGDTKNERGGGTRGGRGMAGAYKHKLSKYYMLVGTLRKLKPKKKAVAINLDALNARIEKLAEGKKAEKEGKRWVADGKKLGIGKLLGKGVVTQPILAKNMAVSENARKKIEAAGGKIEETTGSTEEKTTEADP